MAGDPTIEDHLIEQFVKEWLRTGDPFKAGFFVFPTDTQRALRASSDWPKDEAVLEYRKELLEHYESEGGGAGLPSKKDLALEVYRLAQNGVIGEFQLDAYKLTAQILGYIEKPSVNIDNRSLTVTNKVMVMKDHGSDDAWERRLGEQQSQLIEQAAKPVN